ncbi:Os02g0188201 [Oryza sativa Japonica Group]|uniref:Os02g0188201 protein n=1 Tax=Oryza sativa subsp. japonica TaxID=39947 RepID=A0A0P0VFT5_ORYSJ|nr:Os02g0188201 [Oryza sativa Japonica Group]
MQLHCNLLPPSHNIRDFEFLLATFDHSSYSNFFKNIIIFICDLLYYLQYFKHNFSFFIFVKKIE